MNTTFRQKAGYMVAAIIGMPGLATLLISSPTWYLFKLIVSVPLACLCLLLAANTGTRFSPPIGGWIWTRSGNTPP